MAKTTRSKGLGLEYLGKRAGKMWWRARLYWLDALTGAEREKQVTYQADSKALALTRRDEELEKAKAGTPTGKAAKTERKRFGEAADAWLETITTRSSKLSWGVHVRALKRHFGEWWFDLVQERHLQDYLDAMAGKPGYVNSRRDVLDHVFVYGIRRHWRNDNPVKGVKRRSSRAQGQGELDEEPKRSLTEEEAVRHLKDVRQHDPEAYPLVLLQFHLGCRFAEVSALRHEDLDFEAGIVKIRRGQYRGTPGRTKGRYARIAGLPLEVRAMLKKHIERVRREGYEGADELVFPRPPFGKRKHSNYWSSSTLHHVIERSYHRLGLRGEGVERPVRGTTHVARHTVATIAEDLASASVLQKVLGQTAEIHARYKHPTEAKVIDLAEAVARRLKSAEEK